MLNATYRYFITQYNYFILNYNNHFNFENNVSSPAQSCIMWCNQWKNVLVAYKPRGPSDQSLSRFQQHEAIKSRYFCFPLDGMLVHLRGTPSIKFASTHLYFWVERGTVKVKCLAQFNTMSWPGLAPRLLAPELNGLTMRQPSLLLHQNTQVV